MIEQPNLSLQEDMGIKPSKSFRMIYVSILAAVIGAISGLLAFALFSLIGLLWNLVFFQRVATELTDLETNPIGLWMLIVPAIGGLIVALMAKYGTEKIKGHGIPEAMEAVLENRSRVSPRVAIFKPIATAV
ncbi:MAG TPA: hypothetical protein PLR07_10425, partial [Promineifilum sp.]|nr:hypothetical protein [Promineifilum sp.]